MNCSSVACIVLYYTVLCYYPYSTECTYALMWSCTGRETTPGNSHAAGAPERHPAGAGGGRGAFLEGDGSRWAMRERRRRRGGIRILCMDGGGMRGMATVQMLRQVEARTGRRIHEMFDLIGGTSTGACWGDLRRATSASTDAMGSTRTWVSVNRVLRRGGDQVFFFPSLFFFFVLVIICQS